MDEPPYSPPHEAAVFKAWYGYQAQAAPAEMSVALTAEEMKRVYNLVERLKPYSEVRRNADELLTRSASQLNLPAILRSLTRPNRVRWQERQVSVWLLGNADSGGSKREVAIDTLIQVLEGRLEPDASDRARKIGWRSLVAGLLVAIPISDSSNPPYIPIALSVFLASLMTFYPAQRLADRSAGTSIAAEAAASLGKLRAVKALDIVVAATQRVRGARGRKRARLRWAAMAALPSILEAVRQEDEGRFRADTIAGLSRLLKTGDEELALAVLHSFAHIGNKQAQKEVERLAAGEGRAAYEPRIHAAAQQALPLIMARIASARNPHEMLRASSVPATPTDQLLRPNPDATPFDPMQMLRASADPNWKGSEQEVSLVLQILQHMQDHGDSRALPYVEQLAEANNLDRRIQTAAQACLPALRAHLELESYSPSSPVPLNLQSNG